MLTRKTPDNWICTSFFRKYFNIKLEYGDKNMLLIIAGMSAFHQKNVIYRELYEEFNAD